VRTSMPPSVVNPYLYVLITHIPELHCAKHRFLVSILMLLRDA
jgi:hypothetical protein